jgi:hypothetical protein
MKRDLNRSTAAERLYADGPIVQRLTLAGAGSPALGVPRTTTALAAANPLAQQGSPEEDGSKPDRVRSRAT